MSDFDEHTRMWADEIVDRCYHDSHMRTIEPADPAGQWPAALVGTTATQHLGHYLEHTALARNGWHYIARRAADIERQLQEQ